MDNCKINNQVQRIGLLVTFILIFESIGFCQDVENSTYEQDYQRSARTSSQRYFSGQDGIIRMYVNVWGAVKNPGIHLVYDGIDLATLISMTGGPADGAALNRIKLIREKPDDNNTLLYKIDFKKFIEKGDRSDFVKVLPNDTYVVPVKVSRFVLSQVNWVNTILQLLNLYFTVEYRM